MISHLIQKHKHLLHKTESAIKAFYLRVRLNIEGSKSLVINIKDVILSFIPRIIKQPELILDVSKLSKTKTHPFHLLVSTWPSAIMVLHTFLYFLAQSFYYLS